MTNYETEQIIKLTFKAAIIVCICMKNGEKYMY